VLFNHPGSAYWEKDNNKGYYLRDILRASAAAPYFFDPHKFRVGRGNHEQIEEGVFVDGGGGGD